MSTASPPIVELRCPTVRCGRLLLKTSDVVGLEVEIRCPKCKKTHQLTRQQLEPEPEDEA